MRNQNQKVYVTLYYSEQNETFFVRVLPKSIADSINKQRIADEIAFQTMRLIKFMGYPQVPYWNYTSFTLSSDSTTEIETRLVEVISQLMTEKDKSNHEIMFYEDEEKVYISFLHDFIFLPVSVYGRKIQEKYGKQLQVVTPNTMNTLGDYTVLHIPIDYVKNGKVVEVARKIRSVNSVQR